MANSTDYYVVVTYNGATGLMTLFVNGVLIGTTTGGGNIFENTANFIFGSEGGGGRFMDGWVDEFTVYNTVLDYGNVLDLYAAGDGIPYAGASAVTPIRMLMGMGT